MALIFPDNRGNMPSTHALIIGVGGYPYLQGGATPSQTVVEKVGVLHQLTSPPRSAIAFAKLLLDSSANLRVPLGSIDLLISPAPEDPNPLPAGMNATQATRNNIQMAYDSWRSRCDRNVENIAIFYFCGHGLEKEEQFLLAEDFGANPNNPWLGAFAFNSTRLAFHSCLAETQCFFIDTCRQVTTAMLNNRPAALGLETVMEGIPECRFDLTMQATAHNWASLGPRHGVSYFTQALLKALQGSAATQGNIGWVVKTGDISSLINTILGMVKASENYPKRCVSNVSDSIELLRIVGIPKVNLTLSCIPEAANQCVELTCCKMPVTSRATTRHQGAPWVLNVDAGVYFAGAHFHDGSFQSATRDDIYALPPLRSFCLECA